MFKVKHRHSPLTYRHTQRPDTYTNTDRHAHTKYINYKCVEHAFNTVRVNMQ